MTTWRMPADCCHPGGLHSSFSCICSICCLCYAATIIHISMLVCWLLDDADVECSCAQLYHQAITPNQCIIMILCQSALFCQHNMAPDVHKFSKPMPMLRAATKHALLTLETVKRAWCSSWPPRLSAHACRALVAPVVKGVENLPDPLGPRRPLLFIGTACVFLLHNLHDHL
jgi:hypothetical protein